MARLVAGNSSSAARRQVVLVGSRARGDAGPKSGPRHHIAVRPDATLWRLERRDGFLVPVSVRPFERHCEAFGDPGSVCSVVPGWGGALFGVIHDKLAASLIEEALAWMWGPLERWYDGSVTEEVPGYAEGVHKLVATLRNGNRSAATIQRSLIAVHLAPVLAVHRRILYDSENRPWDLVSGAIGESGASCNPLFWVLAVRALSGPAPQPSGCTASRPRKSHPTRRAAGAVVERALGLAQSASL